MTDKKLRTALERAMYTSVYYTPENVIKAMNAANLIQQPDQLDEFRTKVEEEEERTGRRMDPQVKEFIELMLSVNSNRQKLMKNIGFAGIFAMLFLGPPAVSLVASLISDSMDIGYPLAFMVIRVMQRLLMGDRDPHGFGVMMTPFMSHTYGKWVDEKVKSKGKSRGKASQKRRSRRSKRRSRKSRRKSMRRSRRKSMSKSRR
jgi:hypothetical protein